MSDAPVSFEQVKAYFLTQGGMDKVVEDILKIFASEKRGPLPNGINRESRQFTLTILLVAFRIHSDISDDLNFQKGLNDSSVIAYTIEKHPELIHAFFEKFGDSKPEGL